MFSVAWLLPGMIADVARWQRDPLSVEYDPHADSLISRAIAAHRTHNRPVWIPGALALTHGLAEDSGGRTRDERALQRALYHDERIHKPPKSYPGQWSLQVDWGERNIAVSLLRIRVLRDTSGARHVRGGRARGGSYISNPELRSGAAGSGRERFPS